MSSTSDQTTKPSKTRLIVGEIGVDTETGIIGKGHSYDNGKTFVVDDTIYGRIYHADDHGKIWKGIQDQVAKVVAPAKSAADSAVSAADAAVASAQVTSDAVSAVASATAEAKQGANEAMSRALSAWDVATGVKSAVTDFDPLLKSAQSDAGKALTQIADTASALSDAKTAFNSDVAAAKNLASTAKTTADSAVTVASDAKSDATVAIQTASGASLTAINAQGDASIAKQTASEANVQAANAESDFAQLSIRANKIEANVATNSGAIASVQQTANGLTTTVANIKANGGGVNLAKGTSSKDQSFGDASQTTGWQIITIATFANPQAGQQYTISVNTKTNGGSWRIQIWDGTSPTQRVTEVYGGNFIQGQKQMATITWPSGSNQYLLVQLVNNNDGGQITWNSAMLEEGSVAHNWAPAPSDMATVTSVTNLSATVDGIKGTVANKADQSTVTQLSNAIQSKVDSSTYTSEINQLSNDINLRVKSGDLISQINLQAGTSLIQSNKLVLDSGTTIITGDAFIPSAAISSISADKIMLGSTSLWDSDGTLNLVNSKDGINSKITVTQGSVNFDGTNKTASIIQFASDNNTNAFTVNPTGATVTPTLFFERFDQTPGHWLGFTRNETEHEGVMFHTWDDSAERFFVDCHARFDKNLRTIGTLSQGSWDGTTDKPEAGVLTIKNGNTIWSGSDYLAIGTNLTGSYGNVMARSFSQQSTLSSKTNIETVDPKDALDLVNRTDIRSYQYKSDVAQGHTKRYTSLIIDDVNDVSKYYAPDEFTNEERTGRDDGSAVGYLFLAVKELTRRIKNLEEKLNG